MKKYTSIKDVFANPITSEGKERYLVHINGGTELLDKEKFDYIFRPNETPKERQRTQKMIVENWIKELSKEVESPLFKTKCEDKIIRRTKREQLELLKDYVRSIRKIMRLERENEELENNEREEEFSKIELVKIFDSLNEYLKMESPVSGEARYIFWGDRSEGKEYISSESTTEIFNESRLKEMCYEKESRGWRNISVEQYFYYVSDCVKRPFKVYEFEVKDKK